MGVRVPWDLSFTISSALRVRDGAKGQGQCLEEKGWAWFFLGSTRRVSKRRITGVQEKIRNLKHADIVLTFQLWMALKG